MSRSAAWDRRVPAVGSLLTLVLRVEVDNIVLAVEHADHETEEELDDRHGTRLLLFRATLNTQLHVAAIICLDALFSKQRSPLVPFTFPLDRFELVEHSAYVIDI